MSGPAVRSRPVLQVYSRPVLARHVKLRFDKARDLWVLLAPEKVLVPDEIAAEVLQFCDGTRSIADIAAALAAKYTADPDVIAGDCLQLLQDLADKGFLLTKEPNR